MIGHQFKKITDKKNFTILLVVCAVVAGAISLWIGLRQSVWFDEAYSILLAKQSVGELLRLTALDTHPPLYYLLLKGWAGLFGWSELSLRLLSVGGMMLAIFVGGMLVRRMFGSKIALASVLLLAFAPLVLRYGFEIRMYADAMLIGVAATYALYSAWQATGRKKLLWLVVYGVLVAVGMYLLYYLAFLWIAHVVWLVYVHLRRRYAWKKLAPYAVSYIVAVALFIPWLPTFVSQISNGALAPIGQPLNLEQLIGIITFNFIYQPLYAVTVPVTVVILAFIATFVWAVPKARRELKGKSDEVTLLATYIGVPIVLLMIISLTRSMYTERYLSHVAIGLVLLAGVIIAAAVQRAAREKQRPFWAPIIIGSTILVGTFTVATLGNFNFQRMQTPTVKEATAGLGTCVPDSKLLAADPYVATELMYYLPDCELFFVSEWDTLRGGYAPFSGSDYQLKDIATLNDRRVTYVFYSTPDQSMPSKYAETSRHAYGPLNVVQYLLSAE